MKLRYYLRGLGLGILLTSVLFMAGPKEKSMSDAEVKAKAKELGMVESTVLTELETTGASTEEQISSEDVSVVEDASMENELTTEVNTEEEITTEEVSKEVTTTEESSTTESLLADDTDSPQPSKGTDKIEEPDEEKQSIPEEESGNEKITGKEVTITVHSGDGSGTVAKYLQDAGIVEDAHEFDQFLMANGYDKRISAGQHTIFTTASWDEIGKSLCNMK